MKRREFFQATLALAGVMMLPELSWASPGGRKLVMIHLFGGNDGLNTVINDCGAYRRARPRLALSGTALAKGLALHPALEPLLPLYRAGKMAIVNGVGYPDPDRSHFASADIWHTGVRRGAAHYGWLGRYLDRAGGEAVNVGSSLTRALYAAKSQPLCLRNPDQFQFAQPEDRALLQGMYADFGGHLGRTFERLEGALDHCHACEGESVASGDLGKSLSVIARLLPYGKVFCTALSGFDTHSGQKDRQAEVLGQLAQALVGFMRRVDDKTLVVVYSEFGRRVEENASQGTDHGTAGPLFVLGGGVKGGLYGEYPSLDHLVEGDLVHTVDFRQVYTTLLGRWLGGDATAVLGGRYEAVPFL